MSDKIKTAQERYRDRNREKWNEYQKDRAKQKNIKMMQSIEKENGLKV